MFQKNTVDEHVEEWKRQMRADGNEIGIPTPIMDMVVANAEDLVREHLEWLDRSIADAFGMVPTTATRETIDAWARRIDPCIVRQDSI
jgi:hypothetical protein